MTRAFKHAALKDPRRYIRLLKLKPNKDGAPVAGKLSHVAISDNPVYEALSYTWGEAHPTTTILINGKSFEVRQNLARFLEHQRQNVTAPLLWIDTICISQFDIKEKGYQVQMMSSIFFNAQRVLVWLGSEDANIENALKFLMIAERDFGGASVRAVFEKTFEGNMQNLTSTLEAVFKLPYWQRTWVVQEFLLAKNLLVCYGRAKVTWDALEFWTYNSNSLLSAMGDAGDSRQYYAINRGFTDHLITMQKDQKNGVARNELLTLVYEFRYTMCSDPRDMIYAFIGLCRDINQLKVDYSRSLPDVFLDLIETTAYRTGRIDFGSRVLDRLGLDKVLMAGKEFAETLSGSALSLASGPGVRRFKLRVHHSATVIKVWQPHYEQPLENANEKCAFFLDEDQGQISGGVVAASCVQEGDRIFAPINLGVAFIVRTDGIAEPRLMGKAFRAENNYAIFHNRPLERTDILHLTSSEFTDLGEYEMTRPTIKSLDEVRSHYITLTTRQVVALLLEESYWEAVIIRILGYRAF